VDKLRFTVQEGDFQVSTKGILMCKWGGKGEREGGDSKRRLWREACADACMYMC
jgi:hypothetical protein